MDKSKNIRINESTKNELDRQGYKGDSYNDIIYNLICIAREKDSKRNLRTGELKNFYEWAQKSKFLLRFYIYCEKCEKKRAIILHHSDFNRKNNTLKNIVCLCKKCHNKIHKEAAQ